MPPDISDLTIESSRLDSITNNLGLLNIGLVILTAVVTIATFYYSNKLSGIKEKIANQKIAEADAKAAIANQRAEEATATSALARAESASANTAASEAKNKQVELEIDLAKARKEQQVAQSENAKAQLALNIKIEEDREKDKPRKLTDTQKRDLLNLFKQVPIPNAKTSVIVQIGTKEALDYGNEIINLLKRAGWPTADSPAVTPIDLSGVAVVFKTTTVGKSPIRALFLIEAFNKVGIQTITGIDSNMSDDDVSIIVGEKPR